MNIQSTVKKGAAAALSILMLVSVAACGNGDATTSSATDPAANTSSTVSTVGAGDLQMGGTTTETGKMTYDNTADTSSTTPLDIDVTGTYVQLSDTAMQAVSSANQALTSFDMEDGSYVVVNALSAEGDFGGTTIQFLRIDPTTGKLIDSAKCNLAHAFNGSTGVQWQDIRGAEGYPEGSDLMIQTSMGVYLFDLDDLSKDPTSYLYGTADTGALIVTSTDDQTQYNATYFNRTYDVVNQKIYYSTNEGLFSADPDGSNAVKIADQPEKKDWYQLWPENNKSARPKSEQQEVLFGCMRLFDGGKKLVAQLLNFDTGTNDTVGIAIIDLETNEVQTYGFFTEGSFLSEFENWKNMPSITINNTFGYVDDTTFGILISGPDSTSPFNQVRWDILIDVNTSEVVRSNASPTGFTTDYQVEAVNDSYKGATGKCTFYDMAVDNYVTAGLDVTQSAMTAPHAISSEYGLFKITLNATRDESGVTSEADASEKAYYLVPVVRDQA